MSTIPALPEKAIKDRVGPKSFDRGAAYFRNGRIHGTKRRGTTLLARCRGSGSNDYRVEATLGPRGVSDADCSCPVGPGGYCKHVAAMLLTWRARPGAFVEVEGVDAALARRTKDELIALVKGMLRKDPDLESLIEATRPTTRDGKKGGPPSAETYRGLAVEAFRSAGRESDGEYGYDDYGSEAEIAEALEGLVEIGDTLLEAKDPLGASAVYRGVLEGVGDEYESAPIEDGDIHGPVEGCVLGLGLCLEDVNDPKARAAILRALVDVELLDLRVGGTDLGGDPIGVATRRATAAERAAMAAQVREAAVDEPFDRDGWSRKALGRLYLGLAPPGDAGSLAVCREFGLGREAIEHLLDRGRVDEALKMVDGAGFVGREILDLAEALDRRGHGDAAVRLVERRAKAGGTIGDLVWLRDHHAKAGETAKALGYAERAFQASPGLQAYREARGFAEAEPERWEALRPKLLKAIAKGSDPSARVRIDLEEGRIDEAIAGLGSADAEAWDHDGSLTLDVARASEASRPWESIRLYRAHAERLIVRRNRPSYIDACKALKRARDLSHRHGEKTGWARDMIALRKKYRTLRAFQEEADRAKL